MFMLLTTRHLWRCHLFQWKKTGLWKKGESFPFLIMMREKDMLCIFLLAVFHFTCCFWSLETITASPLSFMWYWASAESLLMSYDWARNTLRFSVGLHHVDASCLCWLLKGYWECLASLTAVCSYTSFSLHSSILVLIMQLKQVSN